ncbi:hypothetical protein BGX21_004143, partial [Mortierella sp. AD011]
SGPYQAFDKTLVKLQERQAFATRPVDEFATEIYARVQDPSIKQAVADFLHVIRSQLAITARQINDMRLDNYVRATGAKPAPEAEKGEYISKEDITARIKAAAEFAKASAPPKATQPNRKNKQGRGNRYGGYGFYGQYPPARTATSRPTTVPTSVPAVCTTNHH